MWPFKKTVDLSMYPHTPDLSELESKRRWLLFVADDMKQGKLAHHLIEDFGERRGVVYTRDLFQFYYYRDIKLPIMLRPIKQSHAFPALKVRGELWLVDASRFKDLDIYRKNGVEFQRERIKIIYPYGMRLDTSHYVRSNDTRPEQPGVKVVHDIVHLLDAWAYIGKREFWEPEGKSSGIYNPLDNWEEKIKKEPSEPIRKALDGGYNFGRVRVVNDITQRSHWKRNYYYF